MSAKIVLPRVLQIGAGASSEVGPILKSLGLNHPLIVTDKVMVLLGYIESLQKSLVESEINADVFDDTVPEPTVASIQAELNKFVTETLIALLLWVAEAQSTAPRRSRY